MHYNLVFQLKFYNFKLVEINLDNTAFFFLGTFIFNLSYTIILNNSNEILRA